MKKLGVVVIVTLAVLILGLPPVLGMLTQSQVNARVAALADNQFATAEVVSYERGWFSTSVRMRLALSPSYLAQIEAMNAQRGTPATAPAALARGATILVDIAHGPVVIRDGLFFGLSKMVTRPDPATEGYSALLQRLSIPYLFEFRGRTGFTGAVAFDADAPAFDFVGEEARMRFSGAVLDGAFARGAVQYDLDIESLQFDSATGAFSMEGISATGDSELRAEYVVLGTFEMSIARLTMTDAVVSAEPALAATNLRFGSDFALDDSGTLANGKITYAAETIDAGSELALRDAVISVVVRNLDVAAFRAYTQSAQRAALAGPVDQSQLLTDVTPAIERLLAARPSVSLDPIHFTLNGEPFDAKVLLDVRADALPPAGALDLRDPALWLSVLDATASATVSKTLARSIAVQLMVAQFAASQPGPPEQIEYLAQAQAGLILITLVGQGLLTEAGENYSTQLAFRDGSFTINGSALPFGLP